MNVNEFVNLIIDLIELNETILSTSHYDDLMSKRIEALELYDEYEMMVDESKLSNSELSSLDLLNSYLHRTNIAVIAFLQIRLVNLRIKQRILEDRKKI